MANKLIVSLSPHVHSGDSVQKNMYGVIIALIPALLVSLFVFGLGAAIVTITSIAACVLFEWAITKYILKREKCTITDGSAILTGLLLAFNLPSNLPLWIIIIGALVAIGVGKMTFGGLGCNPFNPALIKDGNAEILNELPDSLSLFLGQSAGSLGEVSALALLLGFAWLLYKRIITWHIPVSILVTVFVLSGLMHWTNPAFASPEYHLLTGGLMLGANFMASDYVTSPMSQTGQLVYGISIGVLTVIIRAFGAYPEGMSFAIFIMNAFVPLINNYFKPKRFGEVAK